MSHLQVDRHRKRKHPFCRQRHFTVQHPLVEGESCACTPVEGVCGGCGPITGLVSAGEVLDPDVVVERWSESQPVRVATALPPQNRLLSSSRVCVVLDRVVTARATRRLRSDEVRQRALRLWQRHARRCLHTAGLSLKRITALAVDARDNSSISLTSVSGPSIPDPAATLRRRTLRVVHVEGRWFRELRCRAGRQASGLKYALKRVLGLLFGHEFQSPGSAHEAWRLQEGVLPRFKHRVCVMSTFLGFGWVLEAWCLQKGGGAVRAGSIITNCS